MPLVTGNLTDFRAATLAADQVQIVFTPSGPAVSNTGLHTTRPITLTPSTSGNFTVDLVATTTLRPEVWYDVAVRWLNQEGGYEAVDFLTCKVRVPPEGGKLHDLLDAPVRGGLVWFGPTAPDPNVYPSWVKTPEADLYEWN